VNKIILYSTNCPKCNILEKKLSSANIDFSIETDVEIMQSKGFMSAPMLEVDGKALDFKKAVDWINNKQEQ